MLIVIDVDGVVNTGQFLYDNEGKAYKIFGAEDCDTLKKLVTLSNNEIEIIFVTADKRGYDISNKRIRDMGFNCELIKENRAGWLTAINADFYIGDSIYDIPCFQAVKYSACPVNAFKQCYEYVDYLSSRKGGEGVLADICIWIWEKIYGGKFEDFIK
jgi:3-deoxy-D-manno-octulosonate 8-phosphate phosphatase (KDO 8-P phosphatase)